MLLRDDIRFAHGPLLTSADVVSSFRRLLAPETASPSADVFYLLDGAAEYRSGASRQLTSVLADGPYAVVFRLRAPDQTFLSLLAMMAAAPLPSDLYRPGVAPTQPSGTGPYEVESWERGSRIALRRRAHVNRFDGVSLAVGEQAPNRIVADLNLQRGPAFLRFLRGDLDVVRTLRASDAAFVQNQPQLRAMRMPRRTFDVWGVTMNTEVAPFDNVHVRRAVAFSIRRSEWVRARQGRIAVENQLLPLGFAGRIEEGQRYDRDAALSELRQAGYHFTVSAGVEVVDDFPTMEFWVGEGDTSRIFGELVQADLAAIGMGINLRQVPTGMYFEETSRRGAVGFFIAGWIADYPDPSAFFDPLLHSRSIAATGSGNRAFYRNAELDRILDQARVASDVAQRTALYRHASEIVVHEAPWAFVFSNRGNELVSPRVARYRPHPIWSLLVRDVVLRDPTRGAQ